MVILSTLSGKCGEWSKCFAFLVIVLLLRATNKTDQ
jgi:hypothetical protein